LVFFFAILAKIYKIIPYFEKIYLNINMTILKNKDENIFNCQKTPDGHDPIKYIFTKSNENIKKISFRGTKKFSNYKK